MNFFFDLKQESTVSIIFFEGKMLTKEGFDDFMLDLKEQLELNQKKFIVDIEKLEQMNSSGLNLMLKLFTSIRNKGGEMIIIHPNKFIRQLLNVSKLDTVFIIAADKESAIKQLNASEA